MLITSLDNKKVKLIKEIPRNESGKILYPILEDYYD